MISTSPSLTLQARRAWEQLKSLKSPYGSTQRTRGNDVVTSLPARMSRTRRRDASSLWLGSPTCQRTPDTVSPKRRRHQVVPKRTKRSIERFGNLSRGWMKKMGKSTCRTHRAVFRGWPPRSRFQPATLAIGTFDLYRAIMKQYLGHVKQNPRFPGRDSLASIEDGSCRQRTFPLRIVNILTDLADVVR
jgi:hypothetical protein